MTDAERVTARVLKFATEAGAKRDQAWALRVLGEIHCRSDGADFRASEQYFRQSLALSQELGMRPLIAHCHLGRGQLHQRMGRQSEAKAELSRATEMYRQMDMQFYLRRTEEELKAVH